MTATGQTVVLGAGIIGVTAALALREKGIDVTVIDRKPPGEETSYGNAGSVSPWSVVPQAMPGIWQSIPGWLLNPEGPLSLRLRDLPESLPWAWRFLRQTRPERVQAISDGLALMMRDNILLYRHLLQGTGAEDLLADAMLVTVYRGKARPSLDDPGNRLRLARGAAVEIVDGAALREIEPALGPDCHSAALVHEQGRVRDPGRLVKVLAAKAESMGVNFVQDEVRALRPQSGGVTLELAQGRVQAGSLVLALGVWSRDLLRPLGIRMPLIAERGYHLEFEEPGVQLNNALADAEFKVMFSSMNNGLRIAGTAELASVDAPPNWRRAEMLAPLARKLMPGLNTEPRRRWMGRRPAFPDNLPAIGRLKAHPAIVCAFGHGHHGLGMAPQTARMVAAEVTDQPLNDDLTALDPNRF